MRGNLPAVGTAIGARARYPASEGGVWPRSKLTFLLLIRQYRDRPGVSRSAATRVRPVRPHGYRTDRVPRDPAAYCARWLSTAMCRDSPNIVSRLCSQSQAAPELSPHTPHTEPPARDQGEPPARDQGSPPPEARGTRRPRPGGPAARDQGSPPPETRGTRRPRPGGPPPRPTGCRPRKTSRRPRKASGAPGRGAAAQHVTPGYQACTFFVSQADRPIPGGLTWPDTPPAAGRAWVPGCRARTLRRPYHRSTTKSRA